MHAAALVLLVLAAPRVTLSGGGGAGTAATTSFTPAGGVAAVDVQAAIQEVDAEKAPLASPTFTGTVTTPALTCSAASGSSGVVLSSGAKVCLDGSGCAVNIRYETTGTELTLASTVVRVPITKNTGRYESSAGSGSNGFNCTTNGCRFDIGAGASDYFSSDGTTITTPATLGAATPTASTHVTTKAYVDARSGYGTYASRTAASSAGRMYVASDAPVAQWVDTGSAWAPLVHGSVVGVQPKAASSFTAINQSTSTLADLNGAIRYTGTNDGATLQLRSYVESLSSSTATVEAAISVTGAYATSQGTPEMGLVMRESSSGKLYTVLLIAWSNSTGTQFTYSVEGANWTNNTTRGTISADYYPVGFPNGPMFMRLRRDATTIYAELSVDRQSWTSIASALLTAAFTTAPDQVGLAAFGYNNIPSFNVVSYSSTP